MIKSLIVGNYLLNGEHLKNNNQNSQCFISTIFINFFPPSNMKYFLFSLSLPGIPNICTVHAVTRWSVHRMYLLLRTVHLHLLQLYMIRIWTFNTLRINRYLTIRRGLQIFQGGIVEKLRIFFNILLLIRNEKPLHNQQLNLQVV